MAPIVDERPDPTLALLERWRAGDRGALDQLLAEILPWLLADVRAASGTTRAGIQESMDLVQAAVLNFLAWGPRFVPQSGAQLRVLLRRIVRNQLIDQRRKQEHAGHHLESLLGGSQWKSGASGQSGIAPATGSADTPSRDAAQREEVGWLHLALQFLEPDERALLLASEVEGLEWATIARDHDLPNADAARMRVARIKPRLANLIRKLRGGRLPAEEE